MSFTHVLKIRAEVLKKGGIEGIIDIENLRVKNVKAIENRPEDFFDLTYPTSDVCTVVQQLHQRFKATERSAGLFLLEGFKGSGKSHLELLIYHLFKNQTAAQPWLEKHKLICKLPQDTIILIHKFTDFPLDSIWDLIFSHLGVTDHRNSNHQPNLDEFRQALGNRRLVLIFDELERGIQSIANDSIRQQNLAFLQMISEEALRSENASVTLIASVYDSRKEPGATLKRVPRIDVKFADAEDRQRVVLHRLFSNYLDLQKENIEPFILSYANFWKRHQIEVNEQYLDAFYASFPFTPELLEQVLLRAQGFQGPRSALGLLGAVVRLNHARSDIITTAHLSLEDQEIRNRLSDLDPSQKLLQCAQNDLRDLRQVPMAGEIIASVLLATLTMGTRLPGLNEQQLARQVLKPGDDINKYYGALKALEKLGTYFQHQEGNYFFDQQEKPNARIEYRSLRISADHALDYALTAWKNQLFGDSRAVVYRNLEQTKSELSALNKNDLRIILAPRCLQPEERARLFYGEENRNQIILLEPKDERFNALDHADILKWAQRSLAAQELISTVADSDRKRQYERIGREDTSYILDCFKRAGLVFIWLQPDPVEKSGMTAEVESLGGAVNRDQVLKQLQENIFPRQRLEEHLLARLNEITGKTVRDIDAEYKRTLGFPIYVAYTTILSAIKNLCQQGQIGIIHENDQACGRLPNLTAEELAYARIERPFEDVQGRGDLIQPRPTRIEVGSTEIRDTRADGESRATTPAELAPELLSIRTGVAESPAKLQQEVAQKLNDYPHCQVPQVQFYILAQLEHIDFSSLPPAVRGGLTGAGAITIDIAIKKTGTFSKAQVEQMAENLPPYQSAHYRAELKINPQTGGVQP